jgi:hypothetical protein
MPDLTVAEYLRRLRPVYKNHNGRWIVGSESRQRTFAAVQEVLLAGGANADYRRTIAAILVAASRHGAEVKDVWKHVRRYRDLIHNRSEQLTLPF